MVKMRGAPREMTYEAYKANEVESLLDGDTVLLLRQHNGRKDIVRLPADAIVAALQSAAPADVADVLFAWDLTSDGTASAGGVNLVATGSPSFDADMPTFGGGGETVAASVVCCLL